MNPMKNPETIIRGVVACFAHWDEDGGCDKCPYEHDCDYTPENRGMALQMAREYLADLERERMEKPF